MSLGRLRLCSASLFVHARSTPQRHALANSQLYRWMGVMASDAGKQEGDAEPVPYSQTKAYGVTLKELMGMDERNRRRRKRSKFIRLGIAVALSLTVTYYTWFVPGEEYNPVTKETVYIPSGLERFREFRKDYKRIRQRPRD